MIDLHLSAFAPRWRFLYAVRIDAYAPELVEPVLGKMKRVGENFSYPFYAIKAAMLNLLVFL